MDGRGTQLCSRPVQCYTVITDRPSVVLVMVNERTESINNVSGEMALAAAAAAASVVMGKAKSRFDDS